MMSWLRTPRVRQHHTRKHMEMLNALNVRVALLALIGVLATSAVAPRVLAQRGGAPSTPPSRGKQVYDAHCVECHGAAGKGDGPAAHLMIPRPRDFTLGRYKIRSTESGSVPSDDDLLRTVRQGLYATSMPAWQKLLPDDDIKAVVDYVKTLSSRFQSEQPIPVPPGTSVASSATSITHGAAVYEKLQCGKCHGTDGRGTGAAATSFEDDWGQPLNAADLTEPWTFRGGSTSDEIYMRFRSGMSGTPMPSFKDAASDAEMRDLSNYVVSLARKPVWEMTAEEAAAFYARQDAEHKANPAKRGKYLVNTLGCTVCHSPFDEQKRILPGMYLAGGVRISFQPYVELTTGNLTSDKETGLGSWSDDEIKRVITRGTLRNGTQLLPFPMDWPSFSTMKPDDMNAIVAYLRTVPPVRNRVPAPKWTFLPAHLWGKFNILILGADPPLTFHAGNGGSAVAEAK
jgi:cbb3-type cytochrome c oxidase subunit III